MELLWRSGCAALVSWLSWSFFIWIRGGIISVIITFEELIFLGISCSIFELVLCVFAGVHIFGPGLLLMEFCLGLCWSLGSFNTGGVDVSSLKFQVQVCFKSWQRKGGV